MGTRKIPGILVGAGLVLILAVILAVFVSGAVGAEATEWEAALASSTEVIGTGESEQQYAEGVVDISLGDAIIINGRGATLDGRTVRITAAGVYHFSGSLSNGSVDVDAEGKVYVEFDGVQISSSFGPALMVSDAKKVTLTLASGTVNSLTDAASASAEDAALFTNDTLIINGDGTLIVTGNNNEGISSDDDLIINSGVVKVTAIDDGLSAHDDITINGGEVYVLAGGDGVDSNGTMHLNGGTLLAYGGMGENNSGVDAEGDLVITGGTMIASGGALFTPSADSTQCSILLATYSTQPAGTTARVERNGKNILTVAPEKEYRTLVVSSGKLLEGATYDVFLGGSRVALVVVADQNPETGSSTTGAAVDGPGGRG